MTRQPGFKFCQLRLPQNADRDGIDHQIHSRTASPPPPVLHAVAAVSAQARSAYRRAATLTLAFRPASRSASTRPRRP